MEKEYGKTVIDLFVRHSLPIAAILALSGYLLFGLNNYPYTILITPYHPPLDHDIDSLALMQGKFYELAIDFQQVPKINNVDTEKNKESYAKCNEDIRKINFLLSEIQRKLDSPPKEWKASDWDNFKRDLNRDEEFLSKDLNELDNILNRNTQFLPQITELTNQNDSLKAEIISDSLKRQNLEDSITMLKTRIDYFRANNMQVNEQDSILLITFIDSIGKLNHKITKQQGSIDSLNIAVNNALANNYPIVIQSFDIKIVPGKKHEQDMVIFTGKTLNPQSMGNISNRNSINLKMTINYSYHLGKGKHSEGPSQEQHFDYHIVPGEFIQFSSDLLHRNVHPISSTISWNGITLAEKKL